MSHLTMSADPEFHSYIAAQIKRRADQLNYLMANAHALGLRCTITTGAQDGGPPQIGVLVQEPVVPAADEGWDDRR